MCKLTFTGRKQTPKQQLRTRTVKDLLQNFLLCPGQDETPCHLAEPERGCCPGQQWAGCQSPGARSVPLPWWWSATAFICRIYLNNTKVLFFWASQITIQSALLCCHQRNMLLANWYRVSNIYQIFPTSALEQVFSPCWQWDNKPLWPWDGQRWLWSSISPFGEDVFVYYFFNTELLLCFAKLLPFLSPCTNVKCLANQRLLGIKKCHAIEIFLYDTSHLFLLLIFFTDI